MSYKLRNYQEEAVQAMLDDFDKVGKKSIISLPTGAGKSIVIADFISRLNRRVLILQPNREILSQNRGKLLSYVDKSDVGIYSASFNKKQIRKFTFATIQSVYKKSDLFKSFGVIIIDEAHNYNKKGMFNTLIKNMGIVKVYGLTATPYKNKSKMQVTKNKYGNRVDIHMDVLQMLTQVGFDDILYSISTKELIETGYLCELKYMNKDDIVQAEFDMQKSEKKIVEEFDDMLFFMGMEGLIDVLAQTKQFNSVLVFCPSVNTAMTLAKQPWNFIADYVDGSMSKKVRKQKIDDFRSGKTKVMFNCEVLTTGFDHPEIDCIVLARPTKSLNKYNQMLGRGVRTAKGKKYCTIIDITGTTKKLGKIEDIEVIKDEDGWNVFAGGTLRKNQIVNLFKYTHWNK